jgi:ATP-dependent DNA helicase PIF1
MSVPVPSHLSEEKLNRLLGAWESLSQEQREAFSCLVARGAGGVWGQSQIIFGSAGSGKSYYINLVREVLSDSESLVVVTAMTGKAAANLSTPDHPTRTLHSLIPMGQSVLEATKKLLRPNSFEKLEILRKMKILVVDEVSMLSEESLLHVNGVLQAVKQDEYAPFGGAVVVLVGDYKQLPPVPRRDDETGASGRVFIAAKSFVHKAFFTNIFEFTVNYRQKGDRQYAAILERIGRGVHDADDIRPLMARRNANPPSDAVRLYYTNRDVNSHNGAKMDALKTEMYTMPRIVLKEILLNDRGVPVAKDADAILDAVAATMIKEEDIPARLDLKRGVPVRMLWNLDPAEGFCNGTLLTFIRYDAMARKVWVVRDPAHQDNEREHIPLPLRRLSTQVDKVGTVSILWAGFMLSYAQTVHVSQGTEIEGDCAIAAAGMQTPGMIYTAFSRVRSLDKLHLLSFNRTSVVPSSIVAEGEALIADAKKQRNARRERAAQVARAQDVVDQHDAQLVKEMEEAAEDLIRAGEFDDDSGEEGGAGCSAPSPPPRTRPPSLSASPLLWDEETGERECGKAPGKRACQHDSGDEGAL